MKREDFLKLLSQKLSEEISSQDHDKLIAAIEMNDEYKKLADELTGYFKNSKPTTTANLQLEKTWEKIDHATQNTFDEKFDYTKYSKYGSSYAYFLRIAAVFIVVLGVGIIGYQWFKDNDIVFEQIATTNQKTLKVLDDGTKVWLNKKSTISFNKGFGKQKREIFLNGEAYFDVAKNKKVPLFIHAGEINIEVKGTAFNVNAYQKNTAIQVSLVRGAIQITSKSNQIPGVLLKPNEKFIFQKIQADGGPNYKVFSMASQEMLKGVEWITDTLIFRKEKLKDLVSRMERKYGVKIEIHSEQLKEKRFSGTFTTETIQQALEALKLSYPLTYTINNRLVVIKD